ncbi:hypothetical protein CMUS01_09907 [Colletotrichum musicola]|uniref:Uncharacterized protein n=1 Tax=Colletotrichum musicola TaxID=2175873 RepID=A0A8H6K5Q9_9PEZI|nr:hypothetical protein CMUS01_09907 [Colletotrichum musicola]
MKFSILSAATVLAGLLATAEARCFNGNRRVPANHGDTLATLLVAAGNAEAQGTYASTGNYWLSTTIDNFTGGKTCLNFGVENVSGHYRDITTAIAVEGLLREWVGCGNGGKSEYHDGSLNGWRFM